MSAPNGYETNKLYRQIKKLLDEAGVSHHVDTTGGHWMIVCVIGGREIRRIIPRSPKTTSSRAERKNIAWWQKALKRFNPQMLVTDGDVLVDPAQPALELPEPASAPLPADAIAVGGHRIARVEYQGKRVVTFAMVDEVHERPQGTAGRNFRENRERFVDGQDYVVQNLDEMRRAFPGAFPARGGGDVILLTRSGYLKLTKPMNDDRSWAVFDEMLERYFLVEAVAATASLAAAGFDVGNPAHVQKVGRLVKGIARKALREEISPRLDAIASLIGAPREGREAKSLIDVNRELFRLILEVARAPGSAMALHRGGEIELGGVYAMANIAAPCPRRGLLSGNIRRSLDSYCRERRIALGCAPIKGKQVPFWPREVVAEWLIDRGRALIERHMRSCTPRPAAVNSNTGRAA